MRILLTGHKGYVGTVLAPMLAAEGYEVVGFDTDLYKGCTFGDECGVPIIPELKKDIRDAAAADLAGFDAVIHLAGLSNDPLGDLNEELTFEINHAATVRLGRLAREAGCSRMIFSSSCSNYGAAGDKWVTEESRLNPVTPYGVSKVRAEMDLMKLAGADFSPILPRSATVYGVSPRIRFDLVLNNLVAWAVTTGCVRLESDGTAWRPIVHVEDMGRAFIAMLHAPRELVHNQVFNVGMTGENYRIRDLADIVKETVPGARIEYAEGAGTDERCYRVNCDKLEKVLPGFEPRWDARRGARELYDAFSEKGLTVDEFDDPKYKRGGHVRRLIASGRLDDSFRWK